MKNEIEVRPLKRGEEALWVSLGVNESEKNARREKFSKYLADNRNLPPENHLLALQEGRLIGKMTGILESTGYLATKIIINEEGGRAAASCLLDYVRAFGPLQALSWADRDEDREWRRILNEEGFRVRQDKAYFRKAISGYRPTLPNPLSYRSMAETGREEVLKVHGQTYESNLNRNFLSPHADFESHQESAGALFAPQNWYVAYLDGEAAGVVLPQRFPDSPNQGTLMSVGIIKKFRGNGLGKILHAKGMELLKEQGARDYVGSTDTQNLPMLRVFEANGCARIGTRTTHLDTKTHIPV